MKRILIVDDQAICWVRACDKIQEEYDVEIAYAKTNAAAIDLAKEYQMDLILYDIGLNQYSLGECEENRPGNHLPIIRKLRDIVNESTRIVGMSVNPFFKRSEFEDNGLDDLRWCNVSTDYKTIFNFIEDCGLTLERKLS